ncbi:MAG: prolipoprotein diacylglyceryl transferase family protein, partial [Acetobacteraceae bacterium]
LWMARSERVRARFGMLTGVFLAGYAVCRIVAECFRQPDAFLGYIAGVLTMGQILSFPMLLIGIGLIAYSLRARQAWSPPG